MISDALWHKELERRETVIGQECDWTTTSTQSLAFFLRSFTLLHPRADPVDLWITSRLSRRSLSAALAKCSAYSRTHRKGRNPRNHSALSRPMRSRKP